MDLTPTAEELAAALARAETFESVIGVPYNPDDVAAIIYLQYVNVARQEIQGIDLSGSYRMAMAGGTFTLRGAASWLDSTQQTLPSQAPYDLAGTLFNPPKLSARIGGVWKRSGLTASAFGNHHGGVTNHLDGRKSASFSSLDLAPATRRVNAAVHGRGWSSGCRSTTRWTGTRRITWSRILYVPPYDSTNYSPVGRFVSLSVSKRW